MTITTLKSKGIEYCYYETLADNGDNSRIVRTKIGKKKLEPNEFERRRWLALEKHGKKLKKLWIDSQSVYGYHFENIPEFHDELELLDIKHGYHVFRQELTPEELKVFEQVLFIRYVYGTTSLEGNTYTESETDNLLRSNQIATSKSQTEATEIINFNAGREFVDKYKSTISEQFIKDIHAILMKGLKKPDGKYVNTGDYRTEVSNLNNIWFTLCHPEMIQTKMKYIIDDYYSGVEKSIHPIELACKFHQQFEEIHPFEDGNGRIGREILNYMLKKSHFPQIYIPPSEHKIYFYSLAEGNKPNYVPLIDFAIHRMYQSLLYFMTRTGMSVDTFSDEYKKFYESTEGKEEFKKFVKLSGEFGAKESLP